MNTNELMQLGATLFSKSNLSGDKGSNLDMGSLVTALAGLSSGGGSLNLSSLVSNMDAGGLGDIAKSWLGDGANSGISPEQIMSALGSSKIDDFASQLGLSTEEAAGGLSEALPQMVDKASSGGSLLDSLGGVEGVLGMANKLFGK